MSEDEQASMPIDEFPVESASRPFTGPVLAALVASVAGALTAVTVPGQTLPAVAMSSELVWRMEIGAIAFVFLYTVIVVVRLAAAGLTPIRLGTSGVELPQVVATIGEAKQMSAVDRTAVVELHQGMDGLFKSLGDLDTRLARLEERE